MVSVKIDNREFAVRDGITIIEAARQNGIKIPALGYDPRVSPPNYVEVSIVELVNGKGTRFVSATSTTIQEGMNIRTQLLTALAGGAIAFGATWAGSRWSERN